jgi:hypothetical protein
MLFSEALQKLSNALCKSNDNADMWTLTKCYKRQIEGINITFREKLTENEGQDYM